MKVFIVLLSSFVVCTQCIELDENLVRESWVPEFKKYLEDFTLSVTSWDKIKAEIDRHVVKDKYNLPRSNELKPLFNDHLYYNISRRFREVQLSLTNFKDAIEEEIKNQTVSDTGMNQLLHCCDKRLQHDTHYQSRLRQTANLISPCLGKTDSLETSRIIGQSALQIMKV